jgi:sporadic carbohydrate cluster protein (TIGR04323 family)
MKKAKGYIFSRSFMGERAPQHVQNIVIRDYCNKKSFNFLLSDSEYKMRNSFLILKNIVSKIKNYDVIIAYSVFQLPENENERKKILVKIIKNKKEFHFAVEQIKVKSLKDIKAIDILWKIKKTMLPFEI